MLSYSRINSMWLHFTAIYRTHLHVKLEFQTWNLSQIFNENLWKLLQYRSKAVCKAYLFQFTLRVSNRYTWNSSQVYEKFGFMPEVFRKNFGQNLSKYVWNGQQHSLLSLLRSFCSKKKRNLAKTEVRSKTPG